ncbi:MAG: hypothetical protein E7264_08255 [Lachnospiraceae bacterium]|nr:hypothetical protein [Lachnospiraceae bacterium]
MMKTKWISTIMTKIYLVKFVIRILVFLGVFTLYIMDKEQMMTLLTTPMLAGISLMHVLWIMFMVMMVLHIFPLEKVTMALKKAEAEPYKEVEGYSELELHQFVQQQNAKSWIVMLVWLIFNAVFGALYLFEIIGIPDMIMLTVFYFLCDYICILVYCPFQHLIMKNRCCVNCRIYDWGHFMMFTPMLFVQNFFSWSLFFTSCVVLIRWEVIYARHPERFWSGSNKTLQCANCEDKTCQLKRKIMKNS